MKTYFISYVKSLIGGGAGYGACKVEQPNKMRMEDLNAIAKEIEVKDNCEGVVVLFFQQL